MSHSLQLQHPPRAFIYSRAQIKGHLCPHKGLDSGPSHSPPAPPPPSRSVTLSFLRTFPCRMPSGGICVWIGPSVLLK